MNIIEAVVELNSEICEGNPKLCGEGIQFEYYTNGFADIVNFLGYAAYNSENDLEEDVEAAGGIKQFLIVKVREYIDLLGKIKVFKSEKGDSNKFFFQLVRSFLSMTPCVVRSRHDDSCADCANTDSCDWYRSMVDIANKLKMWEES